MAVIRKTGKLSHQLFLKNNPLLYIIRSFSDRYFKSKVPNVSLEEYMKPSDLKKWMPGPYPETEEERRKAAEKYNLHPDEYRPYPPSEDYGDYPQLPMISTDAKDPFYPWDYPSIKKNFNEPLHCNDNLMGDDRYAYGVREQIDSGKAALFSIFLISSLVLICLYSPYTGPAALEKQYPKDGVHYTFESER